MLGGESISKEEVRSALISMEDDKAPGPDGFPSKLLTACWEVMGSKVMEVFNEFHSKNQRCRSLSATFISLIPKKKGGGRAKGLYTYQLGGMIVQASSKDASSSP